MSQAEETNIAAIEFPYTEDGTPVFALAEGESAIVGFTRLWRLSFPVLQLDNGTKVPAIRLIDNSGGGSSDSFWLID